MSKEKSAIDPAMIRELAALLDETHLTEIEVERNGLRIRVARHARLHETIVQPTGVPSNPITAVIVKPAAIDPVKHPGSVTSPMVGTAYRSAEPGAKPFVDIGTSVKAGDTLLIIEAMKTMNQILATRPGTVTQILFEDGQPVEYGEPLMIVE